MAAIEVVDDRYSDWGTLGAIQLIADDFFGAGCVLGAEREMSEELDLAAVSARMTVNGLEVGAGVGADILGDPLTALMWLVNEMAGYGHSFRRGSFVLLGSLVQTQWIEQNDVVVVENVPLGRVTARFD
jgi:2-oxo-3-hexenedioate decarboxylase/2-keto-4-pentenoate hydratase